MSKCIDVIRKGWKKVQAINSKNKEVYMTSYADFGGDIGKIYDWQVADYTRKHMRLIDRFSMRKVAYALFMSFNIMNGSWEEPKLKKKNWKYIRDY